MVNNPTQYTRWDPLRALLAIGESPMRLSRSALAEHLELGEGAMRSVLDELKQGKWITATRRGHALSATGEEWYREVLGKLSTPGSVRLSLYPNLIRVCVVVRPPHAQRVGVEERDLAVKEGAEGAVLLIQRNGRCMLPGVRAMPFATLPEQLDLADGDLVIISFAINRRCAERAVLRIAASVSKPLAALFGAIQSQ